MQDNVAASAESENIRRSHSIRASMEQADIKFLTLLRTIYEQSARALLNSVILLSIRGIRGESVIQVFGGFVLVVFAIESTRAFLLNLMNRSTTVQWEEVRRYFRAQAHSRVPTDLANLILLGKETASSESKSADDGGDACDGATHEGGCCPTSVDLRIDHWEQSFSDWVGRKGHVAVAQIKAVTRESNEAWRARLRDPWRTKNAVPVSRHRAVGEDSQNGAWLSQVEDLFFLGWRPQPLEGLLSEWPGTYKQGCERKCEERLGNVVFEVPASESKEQKMDVRPLARASSSRDYSVSN